MQEKVKSSLQSVIREQYGGAKEFYNSSRVDDASLYPKQILDFCNLCESNGYTPVYCKKDTYERNKYVISYHTDVTKDSLDSFLKGCIESEINTHDVFMFNIVEVFITSTEASFITRFVNSKWKSLEDFFNCTANRVEEEKESFDPEMYELCLLLTNKGYPTVMSCSGHGKRLAEIKFASWVAIKDLECLLCDLGTFTIEHKGTFTYARFRFDLSRLEIIMERMRGLLNINIQQSKSGKQFVYLGEGCLHYTFHNTSYVQDNSSIANKRYWYFDGGYSITKTGVLLLKVENGVNSLTCLKSKRKVVQSKRISVNAINCVNSVGVTGLQNISVF